MNKKAIFIFSIFFVWCGCFAMQNDRGSEKARPLSSSSMPLQVIGQTDGVDLGCGDLLNGSLDLSEENEALRQENAELRRRLGDTSVVRRSDELVRGQAGQLELSEENQALTQENIRLKRTISEGAFFVEQMQRVASYDDVSSTETGSTRSSSPARDGESAAAQGSFETEAAVECCNCGHCSTRCSCKGKAAAKYAGATGLGVVGGAVAASMGLCTLM